MQANVSSNRPPGLAPRGVYLAPDLTSELGRSHRPTTLGSLDFLVMFLSGDDPCLKLLREVQEHSNRRYTAPVLELLQVSGAGGLRIEGGKTQIAASRVPLADISPAEPREAALLAYRVNPPPDYATFKARLYEKMDLGFAAYFDQADDGTQIRLNEVVWGGVQRDGIPSLVNPAVVTTSDPGAGYLDDDDAV